MLPRNYFGSKYLASETFHLLFSETKRYCDSQTYPIFPEYFVINPSSNSTNSVEAAIIRQKATDSVEGCSNTLSSYKPGYYEYVYKCRFSVLGVQSVLLGTLFPIMICSKQKNFQHKKLFQQLFYIMLAIC